MEFVDRLLTCVDCGAEFVFSAGEQAFFHEREFKHDRRHCKLCSAKRRNRPQRPRIEARVTCAECGVETTVPFTPRNGKPVFCRLCFNKAKQQPAAADSEPVHCVDQSRSNPLESISPELGDVLRSAYELPVQPHQPFS